jgi:hypothetical protein
MKLFLLIVPAEQDALSRCKLFWLLIRNTHKTSGFKTSGFKTSGFKTSGFKTSETSGLQNVRFTKCQVYKTSGLQNIRLQKKHPYSACGWWKSAGSVAAKVMALFYSLF